MTVNERRPYCQAISRRQYEATTWGDANLGCSRYGVVQVDGYWACRLHADDRKRYGWNGRPADDKRDGDTLRAEAAAAYEVRRQTAREKQAARRVDNGSGKP